MRGPAGVLVLFLLQSYCNQYDSDKRSRRGISKRTGGVGKTKALRRPGLSEGLAGQAGWSLP